MIRDIPPLAVEGFDPWEKVQLEPATRRLVEHAAAAAGISVEEWLERAIRRACPNAFHAAPIAVPPMPLSPPPSASPAAPFLPQAPRPAVTPQAAPAAAATIPPREIEASLAALAAMAQHESDARPDAAPVAMPPPAPPQTQASAFAARPAPAAMFPPPAGLRRAPTIAERLAEQRLDEPKRAPSADEQGSAAAWDEPEIQPLTGGDDEADEIPTRRREPKRPFRLWATRGQPDLDDEIVAPAAATRVARPGSRRSARRWGLIAVGIAIALAAGAFSAQRLIPRHVSASHFSIAPSVVTNVAPPLAPALNSASPPPSFNNNNAPSIPGLPPMSGQPAMRPPMSGQSAMPPPVALQPAMPPPASPGNAINGTVANLPPVPGLPSLTGAKSAASGSTIAAPPPPPPIARTGQAAPPPRAPLPAPTATAKTAMAMPPLPAAVGTATPPSALALKPPSTGTAPAGGNAPTDPALLGPWLEQRAKSGDAIAQYRLGVLYSLGQGVKQDYQRAAQLFKSSADAGVAEAEYNVAVMYSEGLGIGRDPTQAVAWYRRAASQGNANAAFNLGVAYSNGVGVQQSMDQAAQWFRHAAGAGVVNAQFNLGLLYERGDGVPVSQVEAYAWYSAAAARGDAGATQRRDRLASTLSPSTLKEAQARARQIEATLKNSGGPGAATKAAAPAGLKR